MPAPKNLTGMTFGYLKVLEFVGYKEYPSGTKHRIYKCECKCGNVLNVTSSALTTGHTKSCGCKKAEHTRRLGNKMGTKLKEYGFVDGTRPDHLNNKLYANNSSGVRGVRFRKGKYEASICFKQKSYYLGRYDTIEEASKARKIAEDKLFGEFLDWYNNEYKKQIKR